MKQLELISSSPDERIDLAIKRAMALYCNRLKTGYYPVGLEATFQFYFARILESVLSTLVIDNEMFQVLLEDNNPLDSQKDYVDIVVVYQSPNSDPLKYFIELKFKKKSDSATDLGVIESYIDMFVLDRHKQRGNCQKGYYVFLTNLQTYINEPRHGTRVELPMHEGATIVANKKYTVSGAAAQTASFKYPNGFCFSADHIIEYNEFTVNDKEFWYYIICIE